MRLSAELPNESAMLLTSAIIATTSFSLLIAEPTPTPAAPAVMAIGAVTALSPDEHITGIFTALEMEYAAAKLGVACSEM